MELSVSVHEWLTSCGHKVDKSFCKDEITTHPDYPALTAVIDFLDNGGMQYDAVQTDDSHLDELTYPLLAHISLPGHKYLLVVGSRTGWTSPKNIVPEWSGVVIFPRNGSKWVNEQNTQSLRKKKRLRLFIVAWASIAITLYIKSVFDFPNEYMSFFGFFSLGGLFVSLLLFTTELGFANEIVKQVCGAISSGGCDTVLKGEYGNGIAGITLADLSVAYFIAQFTLYLLGCIYPVVFSSILILAVAGVLIAAASIFIQAFKIKKWCALCLLVASILVFQSAIAFKVTADITIDKGLIVWPLLFAITLMIVLPIKALVKSNISNRQWLAKFKKWRLDTGLFFHQWKEQQAVNNTIWTSDLILGNSKSPIRITVACNPYCRPCASAHKELEEILGRFGDKLSVQMRFLSYGVDEKDNRHATAVAAILRRAKTIQSNQELQEMLSDWFRWMDFETWAAKWNPQNNISVTDRLSMHVDWIIESDIQFTPSFFLNGKKLPNKYELRDLKGLLPELLESPVFQTD